MSRALGEVWSQNGERIGFFDYNGTVDIACSGIFLDRDKVVGVRRTRNVYKACTCGEDSVPVVLYTDYGYGFWWDAKACLKCMAITAGADSEESKHGHPFIHARMMADYGEIKACPKCEGVLENGKDLCPLSCTECSEEWYWWEIGEAKCQTTQTG